MCLFISSAKFSDQFSIFSTSVRNISHTSPSYATMPYHDEVLCYRSGLQHIK